MTAREAEIIELIRKEVKPALGCTEPIAVALAVAKAMEIIGEKCGISPSWRMGGDFLLDIKVSGNILKNGMGVGIPGTGMVGLHIAAALGAVCGKSSYGLEVLHDLNDESIALSKKMVEDGKIIMDSNPRKVFGSVEKIKERGLDVPQVTELCHELSKEGFDVPCCVLTEEGCVEALEKLLKGGAQNG